MLELVIEPKELYNEKTNEFINVNESCIGCLMKII